MIARTAGGTAHGQAERLARIELVVHFHHLFDALLRRHGAALIHPPSNTMNSSHHTRAAQWAESTALASTSPARAAWHRPAAPLLIIDDLGPLESRQ
jgi:hypothetical protein